MADRASPVVLVHGAWHGSWCWDRVMPLLQAQGIETHPIDLPTVARSGGDTDLHTDADALRALLDTLDGPAVVVGHSYGGVVITEGAAEHPNVRHLVYLCAFMPDAHESMATLTSSHPNTEIAQYFAFDDERRATVSPAAVGPMFYNDCDDATVAWAAAQVRPWRIEGEQARAAAWRTIPSTYVVCTRDRTIAPELQRIMAQRAGAIVEWDASHSPFASQPTLVSDLIVALARS